MMKIIINLLKAGQRTNRVSISLRLIVRVLEHGSCVGCGRWGNVEEKETEGGTEETFSSHPLICVKKGEVQFHKPKELRHSERRGKDRNCKPQASNIQGRR